VVGALILQIAQSIIDSSILINSLSIYQFTESNDLSMANWQNCSFIGWTMDIDCFKEKLLKSSLKIFMNFLKMCNYKV